MALDQLCRPPATSTTSVTTFLPRELLSTAVVCIGLLETAAAALPLPPPEALRSKLNFHGPPTSLGHHFPPQPHLLLLLLLAAPLRRTVLLDVDASEDALGDVLSHLNDKSLPESLLLLLMMMVVLESHCDKSVTILFLNHLLIDIHLGTIFRFNVRFRSSMSS
ncbi:Lethal(3)malignant brain tumor-like protein [Trichinella spiralis]|uniref:Lethal(3)malignant brain tumor-like protein n=1 Tax=Trichinella spiralis TaxID=6334 RepID=A0ABR3KM88_TRISP